MPGVGGETCHKLWIVHSHLGRIPLGSWTLKNQAHGHREVERPQSNPSPGSQPRSQDEEGLFWPSYSDSILELVCVCACVYMCVHTRRWPNVINNKITSLCLLFSDSTLVGGVPTDTPPCLCMGLTTLWHRPLWEGVFLPPRTQLPLSRLLWIL